MTGWTLRVNILFISIRLLIGGGLHAEDLPFQGISHKNIKLNYDKKLPPSYKEASSKVIKGVDIIRSELDNPEQRIVPVFWIVSSRKSMRAVLINSLGLTEDGEIDLALSSGMYRSVSTVVLEVKEDTPPSWINLMLLTEYARGVLDEVAPAAKSFRIGWFYSGYSTYLGWKADGIIESRPEKEYHRTFVNYYRFSFFPDRVVDLSRLESKSDWTGHLLEDPLQVYSQAALSFYYIVKKFGDRAPLDILKNYNDARVFEKVFLDVTGTSLTTFESELKEKFLVEEGK